MKYPTRNGIPSRPTAFTLVELLVVIGIIALLIGILLPTLGRARAAANEVKCAANMRSLGQGLQLYVNENKGWLPGPNTSGKHLTAPGNGGAGWEDQTTPTEPTYNMDWLSPTMGRQMSLPANRADRLIAAFVHNLRCPSNDAVYRNVFTGSSTGGSGGSWPSRYSDGAGIPISSYSATLAFHLLPDNYAAGDTVTLSNISELSDMKLQSSYAPKITKVGKSAEKVYAVEGTRFFSGGGFSFNPFLRQLRGGNLMIFGPATGLSGDPYDFDFTAMKFRKSAEVNSFRHQKKMNVVFFDGHVESLDQERALQVKYFWPSGTVLNSETLTYDPNDSVGPIP